MKRLLPVVCLLIAGCLQPTSVEKTKGGDPKSPVSESRFWEALAVYVESEECEDTDLFFKATATAAKVAKIDLKPFDRVFPEVGKKRDFDEVLRKDFAAKVRSLK